MAEKTFEELADGIGKLLTEKNRAYGNAFDKAAAYLALLYPDGIRPDQYTDMLALTRDFDKSMRIAHDKDAFGESPWQDKAGYAILALRSQLRAKPPTPRFKPGDLVSHEEPRMNWSRGWVVAREWRADDASWAYKLVTIPDADVVERVPTEHTFYERALRPFAGAIVDDQAGFKPGIDGGPPNGRP